MSIWTVCRRLVERSMDKRRVALVYTGMLICLIFCVLLSIACGVKSVGFRSIIGVFTANGAPELEINIVKARIPRTVFGLLAGAALSVSGLLMQSITRNPIADPSILGVNTGASLFVVSGMAFLHIQNGNQYIALAFLGAMVTAVLVYGLASIGTGGATPIRLALAGAAASTALQSLVNTIMLPNTSVMDQFRFWQVGSIGGADWEDIQLILPYFIAGFILSAALTPSLNAMALGDDVATGLGVNVTLVRTVAALAGVLLCASVTALAGPISFLGLMVPHIMRMLVGPEHARLLPASALCGASVLLISDVLGRVLGRPGELESGIVTAMIGGPVFILIIRKVKVHAI